MSIHAHPVFLHPIVPAATLDTTSIRVTVTPAAALGGLTHPIIVTTALRAQLNAPRVLLLLTAMIAPLSTYSMRIPVMSPARSGHTHLIGMFLKLVVILAFLGSISIRATALHLLLLFPSPSQSPQCASSFCALSATSTTGKPYLM